MWPGAISSFIEPTAVTEITRVDAQLLERVEVGAVVDLGGREAVPAAVPREERDLLPAEPADEERVAGIAEGRARLLAARAFETGKIVEAGTADDSKHAARVSHGCGGRSIACSPDGARTAAAPPGQRAPPGALLARRGARTAAAPPGQRAPPGALLARRGARIAAAPPGQRAPPGALLACYGQLPAGRGDVAAAVLAHMAVIPARRGCRGTPAGARRRDREAEPGVLVVGDQVHLRGEPLAGARRAAPRPRRESFTPRSSTYSKVTRRPCRKGSSAPPR